FLTLSPPALGLNYPQANVQPHSFIARPQVLLMRESHRLTVQHSLRNKINRTQSHANGATRNRTHQVDICIVRGTSGRIRAGAGVPAGRVAGASRDVGAQGTPSNRPAADSGLSHRRLGRLVSTISEARAVRRGA